MRRVGRDVSAESFAAWRGEGLPGRRVLAGCACNAIKFTERGEVVVSVTAVPAAGAGGPGASPLSTTAAPTVGAEVVLHCAVRDTGIGIPADQQQLVFEPCEWWSAPVAPPSRPSPRRTSTWS